MIEQHQVEQALRRSHCSNTGKEHACVGTCTITPKGVELSCSLCGDDKPIASDTNEWLEDRANSVLYAAGLLYSKLSDEAKANVLRELGKDYCPGCRTQHFHTKRYQDYLRCKCGWEWLSSRGWRQTGTGVSE